MTTLCLCDVNEHDLRVFAEIAAAGRRMASRPSAQETCGNRPDHAALEMFSAPAAHTETTA